MSGSRKRICKDCGMMFTLNVGEPNRTERCYDCRLINREKAWLEEMKELGCSVADPKRMNETPFYRNRTKKDCPLLEIDGVKYRDVTPLLFYDGSVKKIYGEDKRIAEMELADKRRKRYAMRKKRKKEEKIKETSVGKKMSVRQRVEVVERLLNKDYKVEQIVNETGISIYYTRQAIDYLIEKGRYARTEHADYPPEMEEKIIKMYREGYTQSEIGDAVGKSRNQIKNRLAKFRREGRM